jgi:hypothetical protein
MMQVLDSSATESDFSTDLSRIRLLSDGYYDDDINNYRYRG